MSQQDDDNAAAGRIRAAFSIVRDISVSDGLHYAARFYDACGAALDEDPATATEQIAKVYGDSGPVVPQMRAGLAFLAERCRSMAGIFVNQGEIKDVLEGKANVVDLLRGLRALSIAHPVQDGREQNRSLANAISRGVRSRVGMPVEVAPNLNQAEDIRRTLLVWSELVMRAQESAKVLQTTGATHSGVAMVGRSGELRARLIVDFMRQGWGELHLLIGMIGLPIEEAADAPAG